MKNLHSIASVYFFVFALAYAGMALAFRNGFWAEFFLDIMRLLEVPFAFVSLLYGFSTLALQISGSRVKDNGISPWILVILVVCLLLFGAVLFVNFAFPSQF